MKLRRPMVDAVADSRPRAAFFLLLLIVNPSRFRVAGEWTHGR
jgi:hypothetical protein